ncbi:xanthine dehydrogenase family protein molybdopterin-binding subunit [Paenarthrobacter sp. NPDC056912]|uniref:xanthine dehydrogenase family protein molybdopterin-binding subunit n=1 Tax=Paenarthrobacter sp. NPDC056912 TaxID=3345965 RepID=UPI00366D1105
MTAASTRAAARQNFEGQAILRREDDRLLRAEAEFADDTPTFRLAYVQFVRSPYAHARITKIDLSGAAMVKGFVGALTPQDMEELSDPFIEYQVGAAAAEVDRPLASGGKVRFVGEPVVAVAADSREAARDAAAAVVVEYDPLPAVVEARRAVEPNAPVLHEGIGENISWRGDFDFGDIDHALENADHIIEVDEMHFHRFSPTPLEAFVVSVEYDAGMDTFTIQSGSAQPQLTLLLISKALRHPVEKIRILSKDIGGSFGVKVGMFIPMVVLALMARKFRRPVRWTQTRSEAHTEGGHGNERTFSNIKMAVQNDGTVLGVTYDALDDHGAYSRNEPLGAAIWSQVTNACYQIKHLRVNWKSVYTNKGPTLPVRGYSRMQHLWVMERLFDIAAIKLKFDPVEFRLKNYIQPDQYPFTTVNECVYDSGDLPLSLSKVLELIDYPDAKRLQAAAAGTGKRIGIGIGSTLDSGTNNFAQSRYINPNSGMSGNTEAGLVRMGSDGSILVATGGVAFGQGHETTMAQVVADKLGLRPEDLITHRGGDSLLGSQTGYSGSYASQFAVTGIGALIDATNKLVHEIKLVAASQLGAAPEELVLEDGMVKVVGDERQMPIQAIGWLVHMSPAELPAELARTVTLVGRGVYNAPFTLPDVESKKGNLTLTYATQVHAAVVEIDEETGQITVLRYGIVDDCGNPINPMIIQGQVQGAVAHGLSAALFENLHYTADGQLLGTNFYDYHAATAYDMPTLRYDNVISPSPFTPTGAKGMGEGGGAPLHALSAAVQNALGDTGMVLDSHVSSETILDLLAGANSDKIKVIR